MKKKERKWSNVILKTRWKQQITYVTQKKNMAGN